VSILNEGAAATWGIAALATGGVIIRPWRLPEAVWAALGAAALVAFGLLSWTDALRGIQRGLDVYLFLTGMMLLAELARTEGLFDWLAAVAVAFARGSPQRLFALVYAVGTAVTALLSNTPRRSCSRPRSMRRRARQARRRCPIFLSARSSPMPQASRCQSRIPPT
jgi:arsenical pump membrane protein